MKNYGLTGGIGMGKSTAAGILLKQGISVVDSDEIAKNIVKPGQSALLEIQQRFGETIVDERGCLRRKELARLVFADATARRDLEAILHPRIRAVRKTLLQAWRNEGRAIAVAVIPLLFETNAMSDFDATICVACSTASQRKRLHARGWNDDQIVQRNQAQLPVETKMQLADFVIWTEGSVAVHEEQLRRIIH